MKYMIAISSLLSLSLCAAPLKQRIDNQKKKIQEIKQSSRHTVSMMGCGGTGSCAKCSSSCNSSSSDSKM